MKLLARGRTAEVYAWEEGTVLKLYFDWLPAEWIEREALVGSLANRAALPCPRVLGRVSLSGRQGLVLERIDGPSLLTVMSSRPWRMAEWAAVFAGLHSGIHGQRGEGLPHLRAGLRHAIEGVQALPHRLRTFTLDVLESLPDGTALCHFDFHPDQVIMTTSGPRVIDWMTAFQGDRLADVARTSLMATISGMPEHLNPLMRTLIIAARGLFHRRYLAEYLRLNPGADTGMIRRWMIPVAAGRLREQIPGDARRILAYLEREYAARGSTARDRPE